MAFNYSNCVGKNIWDTKHLTVFKCCIIWTSHERGGLIIWIIKCVGMTTSSICRMFSVKERLNCVITEQWFSTMVSRHICVSRISSGVSPKKFQTVNLSYLCTCNLVFVWSLDTKCVANFSFSKCVSPPKKRLRTTVTEWPFKF